MKKEEFIALANKYKAGLCSPKEQVLFDRIYEEITREGSLPLEWGEMAKEDKRRKILSQIERKRLEKKKERNQYSRRLRQWAASIALLMSIGLTTYYLSGHQETEVQYQTKSTNAGQRSRITLSDGSVVVLNSNSHLSFPEMFSGKTRELVLNGEAFFEVRKDAERPFIVRSGDVTTTVLGTSFNVKASGAEQVEVTVVSGRVKVVADTIDKQILLVKGQQATYNKPLHDITVQDVDPGKYVSWVSRSLVFDMIPFKEVLEILERTYGIEIRVRNKEANECLVRGKYENENLVNVLNGLKWVVNFDYHFAEDGGIVIDGKGCSN